MMETLYISTGTNGAYSVSGDTLNIASERIAVMIDGQESPLHFGREYEEESRLGRMTGTVYGGESNENGIGVNREVFLSSDGTTAALRVTVKNTGSKRVHLDSIETMRMTGQSSFTVGGADIDKWKVLRYPFHKSDIPAYYRPTVADKDFTDAAFSCINAIPGQGVLYNTTNVETRTITSGPVMIVKNSEQPDLPILMFCTLGIEKHFILMSLTTTDDRAAFKDFNINCTFDGMSLDPGDETSTHWLMITTGEHEGELLRKYIETVADVHDVLSPAKPSLTVYCTWYFYTFLISEQYVLEELAAIKEKNVPIDVFQIDDGWNDTYGTYEPNEKFPNGMRFIADRIRDAGMIPGIWAAPFVIDSTSPIVQRYPDIYQKDADGNYIIYDTTDRLCYVFDPTSKDAKAYLTEIFGKFREWGFRYYKLDWLRAIYEFPNTVFQDSKYNRTSAYYLAMTYIRELVGDDSYILACGGLADPGNIGLVDGVRTSKDVRGMWNGPEGVAKSGAIIQLKQNLLRSYINRLYATDPDATQIRIREGRFSDKEVKCVGVYQSEGRYTDDEARTICTHQYLAGGMVTISERFPELQDERLALLRHISPAVTSPAQIVDFDTPVCPTLFLNDVKPLCKDLGDYWTLTVGNWEDWAEQREVRLGDIKIFGGEADKYAVFEFHTQRFLGLFGKQDSINVEVPAHGVRVLRIVPWNGDGPVILGTDLHITGGAAEIRELSIDDGTITGEIETRWQYPVVVTAGFPNNGGVSVKQVVVSSGEKKFRISN